MPLPTLGPPLLEQDSRGRAKSKIATIFLPEGMLVTLPGIHATQRIDYRTHLDEECKKGGQEPLTWQEWDERSLNAVDLIIQNGLILIRPDPSRIEAMFQADELLSEEAPKQQIRFLGIHMQEVYEAIKRHGQCWRFTPAPRSNAELVRMIKDSRIGIGGLDIYRYNISTGTRWLTLEQFANLQSLDDDQFRHHLFEIQHYATCVNRRKHWEVDFFLNDGTFRAEFLHRDLLDLDTSSLRVVHQELTGIFRSTVPLDLQHDNPMNADWRGRMIAALMSEEEYQVWEEKRLGLSSEFHMHVQWLPGGMIADGALLFDSVYNDDGSGVAAAAPGDATVRSLIFNYVRDKGNVEYINVGRVVESLSRRPLSPGRRQVYVVEMKERDRNEETIKIIRMQKWDLRERLDEGTALLAAMIESEKYTEYIRDRGLGCRQLGMNVTGRVATGKVCEVYQGRQANLRGMRFWTPYFERNYVRGIATDKLRPDRFKDPLFAARFAAMLGNAAAPNMIVGRCTPVGDVLFDDGDEVMIEDEDGLPLKLVVVDYTGAFAEYERALISFCLPYARPINSRIGSVTHRAEFAENYVAGLTKRFGEIQQTYRDHKAAFDILFAHRPERERGTITYRWEKVLKRLDETDLEALGRELGKHIST